MSVENKIQELLGKKGQLTEAEAGDLMLNMQGSSEKATFDTTPGIARGGKMASAKASKDTSKAATVSVSGDASMPRQGSSQDASFAEMDEDELSDKFYTEVVSKFFQYGEYGNFEIIVDEDFNIVGGKIF